MEKFVDVQRSLISAGSYAKKPSRVASTALECVASARNDGHVRQPKSLPLVLCTGITEGQPFLPHDQGRLLQHAQGHRARPAPRPGTGALGARRTRRRYRRAAGGRQPLSSEERRGGKECVSTGKSRWSPDT